MRIITFSSTADELAGAALLATNLADDWLARHDVTVAQLSTQCAPIPAGWCFTVTMVFSEVHS